MNIIEITHHAQLNGCPDTALFKRREVNLRDRRLFAAVDDEGIIMGIAQIIDESGPYPGHVGIGYVQTFSKFTKRGVSKALVKRVYEHAKDLKKGVRTGWFTSDGLAHLRKVFEAEHARTGITTLYV